jgi:tubulin-specific chaperone A
MADQRIKLLKIKTGVVKRLAKEKTCYEKEAAQLYEKVEKMKADGKDEHDIKKQGEVLQESRSMIPDTERRLRHGYEDLKELLNKESDLEQTEEYIDAKQALANAESLLQ